MVDKANPAVAIMLDKERYLLLDLNAMVAFEEETGKNLFDSNVSQELSAGLNPKDLRALLWACLLHEDESLTPKQVGSWLRYDNLAEVAEKLVTAWGAAMPDAPKGDAPPLPRRARRHSPG